ncbi:type ISP restriction/modification enzyme [Nocardioides ganghwensis]|nr:type ISP restriction/modification enzyme [Nocardioides ganghwensis]
MRKTLAEEFDSIHVYNLRGNARTAGEQRRKEGGTVFDAGSRATVAITVLVKKPHSTADPATIHYTDIGDCLSREQKLNKVAGAGSVGGLEPHSVKITPNAHGDWLNQRRDDFETFIPVDSTFSVVTHGVNTGRDAWVYGSSSSALMDSMRRCSRVFNSEVDRWAAAPQADTSDQGMIRFVNRDSAQISWSSNLLQAVRRGKPALVASDRVIVSDYRPFFKQHLYFDPLWNSRTGANARLFGPSRTNQVIYVVGMSSAVPFTPLMAGDVPNLHFTGAGSGGAVLPRWTYTTHDAESLDLGEETGLTDNITDQALRHFASAYGEKVTKDDIFFYVYGLLHSPEYRETYAADLKKMLPRIPLVEDPWPFVEAGRKLSELHLGYETVTPYPLDGLDVEPVSTSSTSDERYDFFRVQKMAFPKVRDPETKKLVADKTRVIYNSHIELGGIPEGAYRYMLGSRSAIEWILDRYQVKTDKASGIVNDPNDWSREVSDPRYIIDLLARIVTVSLETMKVVDNLPALAIREDQNPS